VFDGAGYTVQGTGSGNGIYLPRRSNVTIRNVEIKEFQTGIRLYRSLNNHIYGNNVTNNQYGVWLYWSFNNSVSGNNITANDESGVRVWYFSKDNSVSGNNIANNGDGIGVSESLNNDISGNNITANNHDGVWLYWSSNSSISENNITMNNRDGIGLYWSSNYNNVSGNNIIANKRLSIGLYESSNNKFYHNNFIDYFPQVYGFTSGCANFWDDGYPSGGNYWSDYAGTDFYGGPYQNETGSDGIGDTAYTIDDENRDQYPLMGPFSTFDAGTWNETLYSVNVISNSTVSKFHLDTAEKMINFNVTGENGLGFCRVTIPNVIVQSMWHDNYTVFLNGDPCPFQNWTDTENTYIYFTYQHSEHEVTIIPEFPSTMILPLFMVLTMLAIVLKRRFPRKLET